MRVTAINHAVVNIALKAGTPATHHVGESPADGTITASPSTPENPRNTGN